MKYPHERGVVSTCSYEARKFGVRSAMPSRTAFEKCPHGIFVKPRMHVYHEVSKVAFETFAKYSPFVEAVSVDEAFLDITGTTHLFGGMVPLAEKLRADVKAACGVTCSVGLAPNRLLAKLASEEKKPDGLFAMPFEPQAIREFLAPKPLKILWGVGGKTAALLERYGYRTCGDIQRADPRFLGRILGEAAALSIAEEREKEPFMSQEDISIRCGKASSAVIQSLRDIGALGDMPESNQLDLFASMF